MSIFENDTQKRASIVAAFVAVAIGTANLWGLSENNDRPIADELIQSTNIFDMD